MTIIFNAYTLRKYWNANPNGKWSNERPDADLETLIYEWSREHNIPVKFEIVNRNNIRDIYITFTCSKYESFFILTWPWGGDYYCDKNLI